jgi:hypothetical protein
MDWAWLVDNGLIAGDPNYYASGKATAAEYGNAIKVAYQNATDPNVRRQLVDMLWATGVFSGDKAYWYEDRSAEVSDLESAATKLAPKTGTGDTTSPRFGIAGGAKLWKNTTTGESYIVYMVPGTEDDPVYMRWLIPSDEDLQSFFGPGQPIVYDRQLSGDDPYWSDNSLDFGTTDELPANNEHPFAGWAQQMEIEAASRPWLLDDDYQKLFAMAMVEGRPLTEAEIRSTNWWKTHNDEQRAWMEVYHGDPMTADRLIQDGRVAARNYLQDMGISMPSEELVNYMADQTTMGNWSQSYFNDQVRILSDPYYADSPLDEGLTQFIEDNGITTDYTQDMESEVRSIVTRWLGTNFGNWDDDTVSYWAGILRNETDGVEKLTEFLKDQKSALFPKYDREATYDSIASPWRTMIRNLWGTSVNDSDPLLHTIINMNDVGEAGKLLTKQGLDENNKMVVGNVQTAFNRAFGGTVR